MSSLQAAHGNSGYGNEVHSPIPKIKARSLGAAGLHCYGNSQEETVRNKRMILSLMILSASLREPNRSAGKDKIIEDRIMLCWWPTAAGSPWAGGFQILLARSWSSDFGLARLAIPLKTAKNRNFYLSGLGVLEAPAQANPRPRLPPTVR